MAITNPGSPSSSSSNVSGISSPPLDRDPERRYLNGWPPELLWKFGALDIPGQDCHPGDLSRMHPLFDRMLFKMSNDDYASIRPALLLASAFLYESEASAFWYAVVFAERQPVPRMVKDTNGAMRECTEDPWYLFSAVPIGVNEMQQLNSFWDQLRHAITYRFADLDAQNASGMTYRRRWKKPYPPGPLITSSFAVMVELSIEFREVLRGFVDTIPTEALPYYLRQHHLIATTILHELCHAINSARTNIPTEPFFEDNRQAELGFTWEQSVLNGPVHTVTRKGDEDANWGLQFFRWPTAYSYGDEVYVHKHPLEGDDPRVLRTSRRTWITRYLVTMDYIQALVWACEWAEIARYGPVRLKMPKKYGLRRGNSNQQAWADAGSSGASSQFTSEDFQVGSSDEDRLVIRYGSRDNEDEDEEKERQQDEEYDHMDVFALSDYEAPETGDTSKRKRKPDSSDDASEDGGDPKRLRLSPEFA